MDTVKAACRAALLTACRHHPEYPDDPFVDVDDAAACMARALVEVDAILGEANALHRTERERIYAALAAAREGGTDETA